MIGRQGDTRVAWNPENIKEVAAAKKVFNEYLSRGFTAFATTGSGGKGKQITEFDPGAKEILFVPPMAGG